MQYISDEQISYTFKIVILGEPGVGKTCLFNRYCFNSFSMNTDMTIGINFHSNYLQIKFNNGITNPQEDYSENPKYVVNSIFDFGGQERFRPLLKNLLSGAEGALLLFDSIRFSSFQQLEYWYDQIIEHVGDPNIPKILVANKSDLLSKTSNAEIVDSKEIEKFLVSKKIDTFFRVSALENYNVLEVFKELTNLMLRKQNVDAKII
jgi:small GTP-binding protein